MKTLKASEVRQILKEVILEVGDVYVEVLTINDEHGVVSFEGVAGWTLDYPEVHGHGHGQALAEPSRAGRPIPGDFARKQPRPAGKSPDRARSTALVAFELRNIIT